MTIADVKKLIDTKQEFDISLKSGVSLSYVTFTRINDSADLVEMMQKEKSSPATYSACSPGDILIVQGQRPFDEFFQ